MSLAKDVAHITALDDREQVIVKTGVGRPSKRCLPFVVP
jgi:hypothetical protein